MERVCAGTCNGIVIVIGIDSRCIISSPTPMITVTFRFCIHVMGALTYMEAERDGTVTTNSIGSIPSIATTRAISSPMPDKAVADTGSGRRRSASVNDKGKCINTVTPIGVYPMCCECSCARSGVSIPSLGPIIGVTRCVRNSNTGMVNNIYWDCV